MGISLRANRPLRRTAALAIAVAVALGGAGLAQAGGACAPVAKTGQNGQRFEWTPGKT